ncbi:hypothetical protein KBI52_12155 [Microvirga sp. HBU67558]|uniref:hypothetical protein n=1 Tax=Microvirga sp. HBU67558 TaxID=2824562 RepID=UPI001B36B3B0|nr:hypothetical protein [Microvirga sp. HBU67558]MBQ0820959.1 hypothetical protein [Microvirga sp. HBU67558]
MKMDAIKPSFSIASTQEAKAARLLVLETGIKYALFMIILRKVHEEKSGTEGIQKHLSWVCHQMAPAINELPERTKAVAQNITANIFGELICVMEAYLGILPKDAEEARRLAAVLGFLRDLSGPGSDDKVN